LRRSAGGAGSEPDNDAGAVGRGFGDEQVAATVKRDPRGIAEQVRPGPALLATTRTPPVRLVAITAPERSSSDSASDTPEEAPGSSDGSC
jgi:hypothetical protein